MTWVMIVLLALAVLTPLALPFIVRQFNEAAPSYHDPVKKNLQEERDALYAALEDLSERDSLSEERRQVLRARYEAKAARVLKRLDEYRSSPAGAASMQKPKARRLPVGLGLLLVLSVPSIALIGGYVLPRVAQDGTVTTNRASDIALGRELRDLQRRAERDPSEANLLSLADTYWQLFDSSLEALSQNPDPGMDMTPQYAEETRETYQRILDTNEPAPSVAYRRLGYLALLENDIESATRYLEAAVTVNPGDAEALYTLGEVYYYLEDMDRAAQAFRAYLQTPEGRDNTEARTLASRASDLAPLLARVADERSEENLLALADQYWAFEERIPAANLYAEVLTLLGSEQPRAVRRIGMALFFNGASEEAVLALERAAELKSDNLDTWLFLGNAYFSLEEYARAVEAWERYVALAGGPEQAGRIPELIAQAQARLEGREAPLLARTPLPGGQTGSPETTTAVSSLSGAELFSANCASCHGGSGGGGFGPRLAGNRRLNEAYVRATVRNGRGMMPGFGQLLDEAEVERIVSHVLEQSAR